MNNFIEFYIYKILIVLLIIFKVYYIDQYYNWINFINANLLILIIILYTSLNKLFINLCQLPNHIFFPQPNNLSSTSR